jgi:radical SAM superfamily enzyme YgiQ (UPF0313 family)
MKKPRLLIIVLFQNLGDDNPYYALSPAPPLPGILLAGMTPPVVDVEVLHEMVRPIDYDADVDIVAISFLDYLAPHAYEVAARFRKRGRIVLGGGKFASTFPDEVQPHFDAILVGEAQGVWPQMIRDAVAGTLKPRYYAASDASLADIPPPRYDLAESCYTVPVVVEATRGCPHPCTYCALNIARTPHRVRPIDDVCRDLTATRRLPWHKRKMAMILDNNLGGDCDYAKRLLRRIAQMPFWAIGVQFSIECLRDDEFVELLAKAHVRMAFIGMESLNERSLAGVRKRQNRVEEYSAAFDKLHRRGILTFTGLMFGLEEDTAEYYSQLPSRLEDAGPCVILPSISIPIYGTPWYREVVASGRLLDTDLAHYDGDHVVFHHPRLTANQIVEAYRDVNRIFYGWGNILKRWIRFIGVQERTESRREFALRVLIDSVIYFKLTIFQRDHARKRVFAELSSRPSSVAAPGGSAMIEAA